MGPDQVDIAIEAGARIPARRMRKVLQADFQEIVFSVGSQIRRHIGMECIVTVRPFDDRMPVHADPCLAHRTVEQQGDGIAARVVVRHIEMRAVPALPHIRKSASAARVLRDGRLEILRNLHGLQVIGPVKRAFNGPVVWHGNRLPDKAVAAEFPLRQQRLLPA